MTPDIVFYTRRRCPLCDEAKAALEAARTGFTEIDVDLDPATAAAWGPQVPVVTVDGQVVFSGGEPVENLWEALTGT